MNAREIYERIQKNKSFADLEEDKRTDTAVDGIIEVLSRSTTLGPHTFFAFEFAKYNGTVASAEAVAQRLRALGLIAVTEVRMREHVDVTVPFPEMVSCSCSPSCEAAEEEHER